MKWILDGTPIERLAAMNEPYADRAGWTGRLNLSPAEIEMVLRRALDTNDQPMFHIVGDRGIDALLSAMERLAPAERWQPIRAAHRARRVSDRRQGCAGEAARHHATSRTRPTSPFATRCA